MSIGTMAVIRLMFMRYSPERGHGPFDVRNLTQVLGPQHREVDSIFDSHPVAMKGSACTRAVLVSTPSKSNRTAS